MRTIRPNGLKIEFSDDDVESIRNTVDLVAQVINTMKEEGYTIARTSMTPFSLDELHTLLDNLDLFSAIEEISS